MKSHSLGSIQPRHSRTRRIEWLIAVAFLLTLAMASGALSSHSTAAHLKGAGGKSPQSAEPASDPVATNTEVVESLALLKKLAGNPMAATGDNSCEL